jgi:hypothetical protein
MNLTNEVLEKAVRSGLELLGPESDISIPAKLNDGIFMLRQVLGKLAQGEIMLVPAALNKPRNPEIAEGVKQALEGETDHPEGESPE